MRSSLTGPGETCKQRQGKSVLKPDLLRLGGGEAEGDRLGTLGLREAAAALAAAGRGGGGGSSGLLAGAGDLDLPGDLLGDLQQTQAVQNKTGWTK